jgi:hypothetical protein
MIQVSCPRCQTILKAAQDNAGKKASCPQCGEQVQLPLMGLPERRGADAYRSAANAPASAAAAQKNSSAIFKMTLLIALMGLAIANVVLFWENTKSRGTVLEQADPSARAGSGDDARFSADLHKRLAEAESSNRSLYELVEKNLEDAKGQRSDLENERKIDADIIQSLRRAVAEEATKRHILEKRLEEATRNLADLESKRKKDADPILGPQRPVAEDASKEPLLDPEVKQMLLVLNAARKECALREVTLAADLSVGCANHAKYLVLNKGNPLLEGLKGHDEYKELKGYTEDGARAGANSVIAMVGGPNVAASKTIETWLASFYHRIPLLNPSLTAVGIGYARGPTFVVACVDATSRAGKMDTKDAVFYPVNGQKNVPLKFSGNEHPDPIPSDYQGPVGFPITITFPKSKTITKVVVKLSDGNKTLLPYLLSTPESPATSFPQENTVCIFPKLILARASTYTVELKCTVSGEPYERTWQFTTMEK